MIVNEARFICNKLFIATHFIIIYNSPILSYHI